MYPSKDATGIIRVGRIPSYALVIHMEVFNYCEIQFETKGSYDFHVQTFYQRIKAFTLHGKRIVVERNEDGFFYCQQCNAKPHHGKMIERHKQYFFDTIYLPIDHVSDKSSLNSTSNNSASIPNPNQMSNYVLPTVLFEQHNYSNFQIEPIQHGSVYTNISEEILPNTNANSNQMQPVTNETIDVMSLLASFNFGYDCLNQYVYCIVCKCILSKNIARHLKRLHTLPRSDRLEQLIHKRLLISNFEFSTIPGPALPYVPTYSGYKCSFC